MVAETIKDMRAKMDKSIDSLHRELGKVRTGRASLAILDTIRVDYYGTSTPLTQMATLSVPESRLITIQPWDATAMEAIEKSILTSDLGLNPSNDGKIIRLSIPPLTEERRREMVKLAKKYAEDARISIRNARRDANELLKDLEKEKEITEDDLKRAHEEVQGVTDEYIKKVDSIMKSKETDIMEI